MERRVAGSKLGRIAYGSYGYLAQDDPAGQGYHQGEGDRR